MSRFSSYGWCILNYIVHITMKTISMSKVSNQTLFSQVMQIIPRLLFSKYLLGYPINSQGSLAHRSNTWWILSLTLYPSPLKYQAFICSKFKFRNMHLSTQNVCALTTIPNTQASFLIYIQREVLFICVLWSYILSTDHIWPEYYSSILSGVIHFDLRLDRTYAISYSQIQDNPARDS